MSFASSPATGGWFTGNTATSWLGLSYTYGTYLPSGDVGDYWRDFSAQTEVDQVLFKTGDGQYWIVLISQIWFFHRMSCFIQQTILLMVS